MNPHCTSPLPNHLVEWEAALFFFPLKKPLRQIPYPKEKYEEVMKSLFFLFFFF